MNGYNRNRRRPSAYISTQEQHLAAQVEVYPKGRPLPTYIETAEKKGFVICKSKVIITYQSQNP